MRRFGTALLLVLLMSSRPVAQETIFAYIDKPQPNAVVSSEAFYLAGWAFNCYTGQQPSAVEVLVYNASAGHAVAVSGIIYWRLPRLDVVRAYVQMCGIRPFVGWAIYFYQYLEPGTYVISVRFGDTSPLNAVRTVSTTFVVTS